jgi:uncharacterized protein (DUF1684 family)
MIRVIDVSDILGDQPPAQRSDPADLVADRLALLDWRRRIAELYAEIRGNSDPRDAWRVWQATRAELFRRHPQSPIPASVRHRYGGPHVYPYDAAWRALAEVEPAEPKRLEIPTSTGDDMALRRWGVAHFRLGQFDLTLELYWLEGYGGGLFAPFADATSGRETYGAGRYLLDTVKGADLGHEGGRLILDFNFAYQPSCSYDPRWTCPLAPAANRLALAILAGERLVGE